MCSLHAAACTGMPGPEARIPASSGATDASVPPGPRLRVVVSTPVLADIVANVAGPGVEVWSVVPSGGDPHTYEATPRDLERLGGSALYVYMGANLERYQESGVWRRAVQEAGIPVLRLADHLELIVIDAVIDHGDHVHDLRAGDPHVWLDPAYARRIGSLARDWLIDLDPDGRAGHEAAAARYDAELARLEEDMERAIDSIPAERRKLVVLHDAYTYLAARFGFQVIGFVSRDPSQEPSAADVAELIAVVRRSGVPAVFAEPQLDATILEMVAAETGVRVGMLLTDSLTRDVRTYLDLMRHDLAELTLLLGRPAAPR